MLSGYYWCFMTCYNGFDLHIFFGLKQCHASVNVKFIFPFFFFLLKGLRRTFNIRISPWILTSEKVWFLRLEEVRICQALTNELCSSCWWNYKTLLFPLDIKCPFSLAVVWGAKACDFSFFFKCLTVATFKRQFSFCGCLFSLVFFFRYLAQLRTLSFFYLFRTLWWMMGSE